MNFFFGINSEFFKSEIQIPLFKNREIKPLNLKLFKCFPKNQKWVIEQMKHNKNNECFFLLKKNEILNNEVYFLANEDDLANYDNSKLQNFNSYTDTMPDYRANLKIFLEKGGFSSYQSEYPYSMITRKGSILSSVSSVTNTNAEKNYILLKNIFEEPVHEKSSAYLVNIKLRKIEVEYQIQSNFTNCLEINNKLIKPEVFLITKSFLGVPAYISIKNKHISFEHTHPPHTYIQSNDKFKRVKDLKEEINEIIN